MYQLDIALAPIDKFSSELIGRQIKLMESQKKIYVMTENQTISGNIKSYRDAIAHFMKLNKRKNALDLCIKIYRGEFEYLGDVPASPEQKKSLLHPYIKEVVASFVRESYGRCG